MSAWQTTLLGAVAGGTIFLGLPLGRVGNLSARMRAFFSTFSAGILLFIFWDVVAGASDVVDSSLARAHDGGSFGPLTLDLAMLASGLVVGALGLAWIEREMRRRRPLAPMAGGSVADAAAAGLDVAELAEQARRAALGLGMLIAVAIGVHNFSEGLAIGVAARSGEIALAGTLIAGFALHNATEGFGIVGPLGDARPSWRWLGLAGLVGGGPTFLGAMLGYRISDEPLQLAFLALAAGAILFVVGELWHSGMRHASRNLVLAGIVIGFLAGYGTDLVIAYAGA
jgi:zinc transporter, ZIP family